MPVPVEGRLRLDLLVVVDTRPAYPGGLSFDSLDTVEVVMAMEEEFVAWLEQSLGPLEQAHALEATRKETLKGLVMVHLALDNEEEEARYKAKLAQIVEGR